MPADPRLLALPSLRRQAEADARENYETSFLLHDPEGKAACGVCWDDMAETEDDPEDYTRTLAIDTHAALLSDLTRWQSQAWALRQIATKLGWQIGDEVPRFFRFEDGFRDVLWKISVGAEPAYYELQGLPPAPFAVFCGPLHFPNARNRHEIPGIQAMSRPEALAAILLHLESQ